MMTAALVSIISRVITSQQFFLYNSITFISISIASIPVPATHIPTTNIINNQYMIPAIISFGIFVLICATDCPASIVQPIKVCMNDAASWKNDLQSERNTSDCTALSANTMQEGTRLFGTLPFLLYIVLQVALFVFRILLLHSDRLSGHRLRIFYRVPAFLPVSLRFSDVSGHNPVVVLSIVFYLDIPLS